MLRFSAVLVASCCFALGCAPAGNEGGGDAGDVADAGQVVGCSGTPPACTGRPASTCLTASGCAISDTLGSCAVQECPQGVTCHLPGDCGTFTTQITCTSRGGCTWTGTCDGTASACSTFSESECAQHAGCSMP